MCINPPDGGNSQATLNAEKHRERQKRAFDAQGGETCQEWGILHHFRDNEPRRQKASDSERFSDLGLFYYSMRCSSKKHGESGAA